MPPPPSLPWPSPPARLALSPSIAHVWCAWLDASPAELDRCWSLLAPAEQVRADRFHFAHDRQRYIATHAILRQLLGRYLGCSPSEVALATTPYGKPYVLEPENGRWLHFNLSHSHTLALFAFCAQGPVGVDVERIRPLDDMAGVARHAFSAAENHALHALPATQQTAAFFACWTRKEAFIKAVGEGLSYPLKSFDVSLAPDAPARLLRIGDNWQPKVEWSLNTLAPARGYAAALVLSQAPRQLVCWQWDW